MQEQDKKLNELRNECFTKQQKLYELETIILIEKIADENVETKRFEIEKIVTEQLEAKRNKA